MKYLHTIRAKILTSCFIFTIILIAAITASMIGINQRELIIRNLHNSSYNLSFMAELMNRDLANIDTLAKWCSINDNVKSVIMDGSDMDWLNTYDELKDIVQNNPSFSVLDRLIIMDKDKTRFMQYAPQSTMGKAINHELVTAETGNLDSQFSGIEQSYFFYPYINVIRKIIPIIDYNTQQEIGYVYAAVSVNGLLSNLYSYAAESIGTITLTVEDRDYNIAGPSILPSFSIRPESSPYRPKDLDTSVEAETYRSGRVRMYSIAEKLPMADITIRETIAATPTYLLSGSYALLTILAVLLVILSGALLASYLNRLIVRPVRRMTKRLEAIGKSDFSRDPSIESDDELGDIGHGINNMASNIDALMARKLEDEKKKQELEYRMLQNQINPHFLYNTLNSIKWMATIQHASGIAEMVTSLSRLMKTISKSRDQMTPLSEEISFSREYMTIMRYRYGSTLEYREDIDERTLDVIIPRFTLQPLLENAIFHGIEPKGAGCVTLKSVLLEDGNTEITVRDNGCGFDASKAVDPASGGMFKSIGLENIRNRLDYAYEGRALFEIESRIGEYTLCRIVLPGGGLT